MQFRNTGSEFFPKEVTETASELQDIGTKITSIRDADLKEMNDYVRAYSELAPLLDNYDRQLQQITDLYGKPANRIRVLLT